MGEAAIYIQDAHEEATTDGDIIAAMKLVSTIAGTKIGIVVSDEQATQYTEMLVQAKTILKEVEAKRKAIVDPFNRAVKATNDWFKTHFSSPIATKEQEINQSLVKWRQVQAAEARKRQEEAEKLQREMQAQAAQTGIEAQIPAIITPPRKTVAHVAGGQVQERKQLVVEVTDIKELARAVADGAIPDTAVTAEMKVLRNLAMAGMQIPGVKYGYKAALAVITK